MAISIEQIIIQLGIGAFSMYLFYKYAMYIAKKSMNGMLEKMDRILEKQDKILVKIDLLLGKINNSKEKDK